MLVVVNKGTQDEHLDQPLQTNNKQFEKAVTFLTGYNGIFNVTSKNNKFESVRPINDGDFSVMSFSPGVFERAELEEEIERVINDKGHFTGSTYPFKKNQTFQHYVPSLKLHLIVLQWLLLPMIV